MTALKILLSAHAWNLQANILHLDQKAVKCTTCKWLYSKFWLFVVWKWPENGLTRFKTQFFGKISWGKWVNKTLGHATSLKTNNCTKTLFATLLASETCKVFRLRSCLQNKMTWQRIAVKEKRRLSPDKTLWASKFSQRHLWTLVTVEKILVVKKSFALEMTSCWQICLQNKQNFALCEKGLTHIKFNLVTIFFTTLLKKLSH